MTVICEPKPLSDYPEVMKPEDLQEYFRVARTTVYGWLKQGLIGNRKVSGLYFIPKREVERFTQVMTFAEAA